MRSAHDCADGGLAVALAESCFSSYRRSALGASIELADEIDAPALLFGETPSRIFLSVGAEFVARVKRIAQDALVPCTEIGRVGGDRLRIVVRGDVVIDEAVADLEHAWKGTLDAEMAVGK